jgi:hypothetical protein
VTKTGARRGRSISRLRTDDPHDVTPPLLSLFFFEGSQTMTVMIEPWTCKCGYTVDCAESVNDEEADEPIMPTDGDYTFCIMCAEMYVWDSGKFRPITDDELIDMPLRKKQHLSQIQLGIREFHKQRRK